MDAGFFDVLHDSADVEGFSVKQGINVDFYRVVEETVNQKRSILGDNRKLGDALEVVGQALRVVEDFHASATQHETGTNEHGIADVIGNLDGSRRVGSHPVFG